MGSRTDFTQKLLHDLKLRKQRMAASQSSEITGDSRQILKGSRETKSLEPVGPKVGSTYKSSNSSRKTLASAKATNQIVPYGRGHNSGQTGDLSVALSYAFDDRGKLKSFDFTSNGAMMSFLQQLAKRSTPRNSSTQWQSTNQFPTLTHLHIDEIAKGAQKLNHILRACSSGLNIDKGSIEISKELWKGALELEQSLRMLASLQEASECMTSPQRKGRLKLLEDGEDSEDNSPISTEKQKQVERPVFSFDKASKNSKSTIHNSLQQKVMALTYLQEPLNSIPEKQESTTSKSIHRRSASCGPEFQASQHTDSSKLKQNTAKIPNVIAKLMGLEELAHNVNTKIATESQAMSKQTSSEVLSTRSAYGTPRSAEVKIEYANNARLQGSQSTVQSNQITIMKSHQHELQKETYRFTYDYSYRVAADPQNTRWNDEQKEQIRKESQEAVFKINELQSQIKQLNRSDASKKGIKQVMGVSSTRKNQQKNKDDTKPLQTAIAVKKQNSDAETLGNMNIREAEKRATNKPMFHQQKQKKELQMQQLQILQGYDTQGKYIKSEDRSQQRPKNRSEQVYELRKIEERSKRLKNSSGGEMDVKKPQKQPRTKQPNLSRENNAKESKVTSSTASQCGDQYDTPVIDGNPISFDGKQNSSVSLKPEQNSPDAKQNNPECLKPGQNSSSTDGASKLQTPQASISSSIVAKPAHVPAKKLVDDIKPPKLGSRTKTNEVMNLTVKNATKTGRVLKTRRPIQHGEKQKTVEQVTNSRESHSGDNMSTPLQTIPENARPATLASQEQTDSEAMATTNNPSRDESHCRKEIVDLPPSSKSQDVEEMATTNNRESHCRKENVDLPLSSKSRDRITSKDSGVQHDQHIVPNEFQEVETHKTATDDYKDDKNNSDKLQPVQQRPTKREKQEPLTEDEMNLKHKLIKSNLFLNTAEALFKLNIPISVLNYASDQICQEKDSKLILDCGYEVLKRKGRRQEIFFYPRIKIVISCTVIETLDDLVRQLHREFQTLRSYGSSGRDQYDDADYLLKMLERDINYTEPDVNCMWDLGWNEKMFAYVEMDEVIKDVEQEVLAELVDEIAKDYMYSSHPTA